MFVYMPEKPGFLFYFMLIVLTITVIFMIVGLLKASFAISKRDELKRFGIKVSATVVGRESDIEQDPQVYLIYYQFHPDFVVKHHDETEEQSFFKLPIGSKIDVLYLEKSPQITGVYGNEKKRANVI